MRRRPALLSALTAAALVAVALAGCAPQGRGPGNQPAGCTPEYASGDASNAVTASGSIGATPKVKFPTPVVAKSSEVTVLKPGTGRVAQKGSIVDFDVTVYNGRTGKSVAGTAYDGGTYLRAVAGKGLPPQSGALTRSSIADALVCAQAGSRIALTSPNSKINAGLTGLSSAVAVIDVNAVYLGKADGVNQLPKDGMPNVITAVDGQPGIVIQELTKPTTVRTELVKAGGGAVVTKTSRPVVMMTAWTWPASSADKPTVLDQQGLDTWTNGTAISLDFATSPYPKALNTALIGQKVGSQVLVVLPPKDGFPASGAPQGVTANDTLIFVVDIVGIQK
ncbi:FKBP-type peptidyl-prolyl cis-trans isomerase [Pseudolysinimonas sp.]|uniref:FKBP-type peptidyl-prolyl cis-trans isomerase n=1 Tax=Pseudolysinimonas sp. TaxID=2680009 RepID=UPI003F7DD762